jgi:activator of HSP90 ATPase
MLIHQEAIINADPQAVYDVLTDGQKFATATGMPAQLSDREGETFTLFDGRIEGRQIELVPGQRIVQAWRFGAAHPSCWDAGVYSVVRFTLSGQKGGTHFVIDHTGVPPQWHEHISGGYPTFYQQPLERYFALELAETGPERQFLARRLEELA